MIGFFTSLLQQVLLFFPLVLAMYVAHVFLHIPDLSIQGSYVLGAALFAKALHLSLPLPLSFLLAILGGACSGLFMALIQYREKIHPLVAGVLSLYILHSLFLLIMGKPNLSLLNYQTYFHLFASHLPPSLAPYAQLLLLVISALILSLLLFFFLSSARGKVLRAFGENRFLLKRWGKNIEQVRMEGLMISGMLAAFSGFLSAQMHGFCEISMGEGQAIVGIVCVLIGQQLYRQFHSGCSFSLSWSLFFCFCGTLLYYGVLHLFLHLGVPPIYLQMIMGIGMILSLLLTTSRPFLFSDSFESQV